MSQKKHSIMSRFGFLLSAYWVREGLQAALLITLARVSSETYGQLMLAINLGQMLLFISEFGLNQHLATLLARKEGQPTTILAQITLIKSFLLTVSWLCMIVFIIWQGYDSTLKMFVLIVSSAIGLESLASTYFTACQVFGRQDVEGRVRGTASLLGYGYGLAMLLSGAPMLLVALFKPIDTLVNVSAAVRMFWRRGFNTGGSGLREVWLTWREGIVYTAMAVAAIFYNKINMFFLQRYAQSEGVAQYSATWQLVDGVSILVSALLLKQVLFPMLAKLWGKDREKFIALAQKTSAWLMAVALPLMYGFFVESDRLIMLIYGNNYGEAAIMQRYLVPCIFFAFIHNLAAYLMISMHRQRLLLLFTVLGLAFNLAACMILIPADPMVGTALTITLTKGFVAVMTIGFCMISIKFITFATWARLLGTLALSGALWFAGTTYATREVGEILGVLPMLHWTFVMWRSRPRPEPVTE